MASGSDENQIRKIGANIEADTVHYSGTVNVYNKDDGLQPVGTNIRAQTVHIENPPNLNIEEFDLPPLIKIFKGRDEDLAKLHTLFFEELRTKIVVCSLPGYGKSELSKQFANSCLDSGKVKKVFWVYASELRKAATSLKKIYKIYKDEKCLFVFDDGVSRQSITDYEPPDNDNFLLLITSLEKDWGDDIHPIPLNPLSPQSSIDFYKAVLLTNFQEQNLPLYEELASIIGNIPLGLQITAGYMRQDIRALRQAFQLEQYVERIKKSIKEVVNKKIPRCTANSYDKSIYGAMRVSLERIKEEEDLENRDLALYALYLCAFLNPERIILEDLLKIITKNDAFNNWTYIDNKCKLALNFLDNLLFIELIYREYFCDTVKIHRLTQDILRIHMSDYEPQLQIDCYSMCLTYLFYFNTYYSHDHTSTIFRYADDNLTIVNNFSTKCANDSKFEHFVGHLIQYGCINSLKHILQENKQKINEHIYELLREAVFHNQINCLRLLLKESFDINLQCYQSNYTLLHEAAWKCNLDAIKILIVEQNADVNIKDKSGNVPLFNFVAHYYNQDFNWPEVLTIFKFDKETTNNKEQTLLHIAAKEGPVNLLNLLITEYKMNVNQQDVDGKTPLHLMPTPMDDNAERNMEKINLLLKHGASLHITDKDSQLSSYMVVRYAHKCKDAEMLEWLKKENVDIKGEVAKESFLNKHQFRERRFRF